MSERKPRRRRMTLGTKLMVWFNGGILFATTVYAIVAYKQWRVMERSLGATRQAFEISEAAKLVVGGIEKLGITVEREGFFTTEIKNVGRLPARNVRAATQLYIRRLVPEQPQYKVGNRGAIAQAIAPGVPGPILVRVRALNTRKFAALCRRQVSLRLFGEVRYHDGFREAPPLKFCMSWEGRAAPCNGEWVSCPTGTWAEE